MVIAVTVVAAVILYAATEGLWLGIHGKLLSSSSHSPQIFHRLDLLVDGIKSER
jgi:hypothetical protein